MRYHLEKEIYAKQDAYNKLEKALEGAIKEENETVYNNIKFQLEVQKEQLDNFKYALFLINKRPEWLQKTMNKIKGVFNGHIK